MQATNGKTATANWLDAPTVIRRPVPDICTAIDDFLLSWAELAHAAMMDALRGIEAGIRRVTP